MTRARYIGATLFAGVIGFLIGTTVPERPADPAAELKALFRAEKIGICEGEAWTSGSRDGTSAKEDYDWAAAIVDRAGIAESAIACMRGGNP